MVTLVAALTLGVSVRVACAIASAVAGCLKLTSRRVDGLVACPQTGEIPLAPIIRLAKNEKPRMDLHGIRIDGNPFELDGWENNDAAS